MCKCGRLYRVSDALAGRNATCKNCQSPFVIPGEPAGGDEGVAQQAATAESPAPPPRPARKARAGKPAAVPVAKLAQPWHKDKLVLIGVGGGIVLVVCGLLVAVVALSGSQVPDPADMAGVPDGPTGKEPPRVAVLLPQRPVVPPSRPTGLTMPTTPIVPDPVAPASMPTAPVTPKPAVPIRVPTPSMPMPPTPTTPATPPIIKTGAYCSPFDAAFSPSGVLLAVSDHTAAAVAIIDVPGRRLVRRIPLLGEPTGVAWSTDPVRLYVAELGAGSVAEIDPQAGRVLRRLGVGARPVGIAVTNRSKLLLAANTATNTLSVVDLTTGRLKARLAYPKWPAAVAITPDESVAVVANQFPAGSAAEENTAAAVSLLDLTSLAPLGDILLPAGSSLLRDVVISGDGRWAYVSHTLGRTNLPTSQLDRGWVNTNSISIIDIAARKRYATLLLDRATDGATNPWGLAVAADSSRLWVALSGAHEIATIELAGLHQLLAGGPPDPAVLKRENLTPSSIWARVRQDAANREHLAEDLSALWSVGVIKRSRIPGNGPRGLAVSPDGKTLAAAVYFSGQVVFVDTDTNKPVATVPVGPARTMTLVRRGEMTFNDGELCYQRWLSCATCHPDGRADALNWDLLNDGLGNPKNTKSLLWSHQTPPMMATAVRKDFDMATSAGFRFLLFRQPEPSDIAAVRAYLRSMKPARSPWLSASGTLTPQAVRGKAVFDSPQARCGGCHPTPLLTDLRQYDVGTRGRLDRQSVFDTPSLVELWRSGPYLHDGSAPTLMHVVTTSNKGNQHGGTAHLSKQRLEDLVVYLLSL